MDSDDDTPQLSAHALAALREFYTEQAAVEEELDSAQLQDGEHVERMPEEDWQLSQFWYDDETASVLAKEAVAAAGINGRIACLSCPTLYKKLCAVKPETCLAVILEYDNRFQKLFHEDFVFYDYNEPLALPDVFEKSFDLVVADPPFLSEECLTKTSQSINFLAKEKVLLCTGATMEELANKLLGAKLCQFTPHHSNNLANEFCCYANYNTHYLDLQTVS